MARTHTAPHDYQKAGYLYESVMLYTCRTCGRSWDVEGGQCLACERTERQAWMALYNEEPDACEITTVPPAEPTDEELADLIAWLNDGFGFNDPAGAALAELAQSERNHEAVDAASPL